MKRIAEGVYQLVTPFPEYRPEEARRLRADLEAHPRVTRGLPYVLPYLIVSGGETLLVDCGWNTDEAHGALAEELRQAGSSVGEIGTLLITHAHPDHCGMAGRLQQEAGCALWLHEREAAMLGSRYGQPEQLVSQMQAWLRTHGVSEEEVNEMSRGSMAMRPFVANMRPDRLLQGGEELRVGGFVFEVVWTPGHAPGHVCLYERNHKLLITGDHVLPSITPNVSLHPQQPGNPLGAYVASLQRVEALDVARMLPAHEWDIDWFQRRVAEIRAHHEARLQDMLAAVGDGPASAAEVASRVAWATGRYEGFPPFMKRAALGETLAHLEYLVEQGALRQVGGEGAVRFVRA